MVGPGRGLEIVSSVNNIPKGSRLAVSTNAAGGAGQRVHAGHRAGGLAHRPVAGTRAPAGAGAGAAGRMAGRLRRRLAGLGRRLAGHEADRRRAGGRRRPGVRHQPRPADAAAPHPATRRTPRRRRAASCRTAWCWCTAAWRKTSGPSWRWSPRSTCCAARRNGKRGRACWAFSTRFSPPCAAGRCHAHRRRDHAEFPPARSRRSFPGRRITSPRR